MPSTTSDTKWPAAPSRTCSKNTGWEPAPERTKRRTWREFLGTHWDALAAADFFSVEGWTLRGLTRFTVLVLIKLATRRVHVAGLTAEPEGPWATQLMRNATDAEDGFLRGTRMLIHDRDPPDTQEAHHDRERQDDGEDDGEKEKMRLPMSRFFHGATLALPMLREDLVFLLATFVLQSAYTGCRRGRERP